MNIKSEKLPKSRVKLTVTVLGKDLAGHFDKATAKLGAHVEVKGFRPGKAPKELIIDKVGPDRITTEALETALPESYAEAIKQENLLPIASPSIKIEQFPILGNESADLIYVAEVDLFPELKLGDYKKIRIKKNQFKEKEITDKETTEFISYLQKQRAKFNKAERGAKNGDRIEIDFEGSLDNVVQENMVSKNHPVILGDKTLIPGFEEELVGLKADDEKEFTIAFPKDYHAKELVGKKAKFKVKMNQVEEMELPQLDDNFAKELGHDHVDELKKAIAESLQKQEQERVKQELENQLVLEALKLLQTEVPQAFIDKELDHMVEDIKQRAYLQGLTFEKYLEYLKKTEEELRSELTNQAEQLVKVSLMLGEVIKREGLDEKDKEAPKKAVEKMLEYSVK